MNGMSAAQDESGWADGHVREFARRFAALHRPSWPVLVPDLREALIDSFVLMVVLGQSGDSVGVGEIRSLRTRLATQLAEHHKMPNPTATEFTSRST